MPDVLLQDYLEEISNLIDESRLGEAVRHCRFILEQYPRHVDTYRLLGKAFLEQGELEAAADVFRRVLSADPEDFIAHAGLAIIYKQEDQYKQAVWHMERAFEVDPYNAAIQEALMDLYGRRDGLPPGQLPLTRGALSRLYVKGEMYGQAIAELGELVEKDDQRVDLKVLLAEALWRDSQRVDAVNVCQSVLEELPDCIKANAILADIRLMTERHDEARPYMQRVYDLMLPAHDVLDGDSPVGRLFRTEGALELQEQVYVERLQESAALGMAVEDDDWVEGLELSDDDLLGQVEPEWLEVLQREDNAAGAAEDDDEASEWPAEVSEGEVSDGEATASDSGLEEAEREAVGPPDASNDVTADPESRATRWLEPADELTGLGETPEDADWEQWLQQEPDSDPILSTGAQDSPDSEEVEMGAAEEYGKGQEDMPEDEMPEMENEQGSDAGDDSFDWLQELGDAEDSESDGPPEEVDDGGLPDWLADDSVSAGDDDDSLQWLEEMENAEGLNEEASDDPAGGELPDWLREEATASEAEGDEDLSWLDQIAAGEGTAIEEPPTLSWPEDEAQPSDASQPEASFEDEADAESEESVVPPEASEFSQEADDELPAVEPAPGSKDESEALDEVPEDLEDAMAWLEQLAAQQGAPVEELPPLSDRSEADDESLLGQMPEDIDDAMAWLDDLSEEESAEASALPPVDESSPAESRAITDETVLGDTPLETPVDPQESEDVEPETELPEMGEAFESDWIEELAEAPADEIDDSAGPMADVSEAAAEEAAVKADEEEQQEEPEWLEELGDDVEVDEAWLDELAATEESEAALESPEVFEEESDMADDALEDEDEAMVWLEQLAASQGASVDELLSFDEFAEGQVEAHSITDLDDIPEDPEAALAWLESLAEGEEFADDDSGVVEEPPTPAAPQDVVAARAEAEAILLHDEGEGGEEGADELFEEMPEDPDEAMAWLERLAARQGAPLDELPSVTSAEDEVVTPDWIAREASEVETEDAIEPVPAEDLVPDEFEGPGGDEESLAVEAEVPSFEEEAPPLDVETPSPQAESSVEDVDEAQPIDEDEGFELDEAEEEIAPFAAPEMDETSIEDDMTEDIESEVERALMSELTDDELGEALPSWLALEGEEADELDWEAADADIASWLQAEDEATQHELEVPSISQTGELATGDDESTIEEEPVQPGPVAEAPELADAEVSQSEVPQWASAVADMDTNQLEAGRRALETGDFETALSTYRQLLETGEGLGVVVDDLETASSERGDQPQLWQLLGDAYMQNGQLQKALDAYRQALDRF